MQLEGRLALVTGAARRVGRAIAVRLAQSGCRVALHYHCSEADARSAVDACRAVGPEAEAFEADLADRVAAEQLVRRALDRFGRLDILVNNASVFGPMTIDAFDADEWERTLRVNLTAPMILTHAARGALREARGRVVNICDAATAHPWASHLAYMASKGALETLTRALARALAPDVNVTGVAPGIVAWPAEYDEPTRDRLTAQVPLRRAGSPEDVAGAVHFLLREGDYVTGSILAVDGGRNLR